MTSGRPAHQNFLDEVNDLLVSARVEPTFNPANPVVVVAGCPRSGTTVCLQQLQAQLSWSVVNHLAAAFWKRPDIGMAISRLIENVDVEFSPSLNSDRGLTKGWREPHEFSYFWRDALNCNPHDEASVRNSVSVELVAELLQTAAGQTNQPLALKGFPALWIGDRLINTSPQVRIILMKRPIDELTRSVTELWSREVDPEWVSLRPQGWEELCDRPVRERIEFQVDSLIASTDALLSSGDPARVRSVSLVDLRESPDRVCADIMGWVTSSA